MGQVVYFKEVRRAQQRRWEKIRMGQCVELLEWNLKRSLDCYFASPLEEKSMRATQVRKLSEILEYAVRLV
ncbi:MAG: hypothetical protein ACE5HC_01035 [Candidatus Binatia bacterium]